MVSLICGILKSMNKQNRKRPTDTENTLIIGRWEGVGGMSEKGEGIKSTNW